MGYAVFTLDDIPRGGPEPIVLDAAQVPRVLMCLRIQRPDWCVA